MKGMRWWRVKSVANVVNGSTLLGLGVARVGRARLRAGPRGLVLATGYRLDLPRASAFTVGNVVVTTHDAAWLSARPRLLAHEERHSWQYVVLLGIPMVPLYLLATGYSFLRGGDRATHNVFERFAGLADGGYPTVSRREHERLPRSRQAV
jgi:hypothetical protein